VPVRSGREAAVLSVKTDAGQRAVARRIKPAVFPLKNSHIWSPYDLDEATASLFIFLFLEIEADTK